jgi:hypothetical protein
MPEGILHSELSAVLSSFVHTTTVWRQHVNSLQEYTAQKLV